jgi:hypothetical protein
MTQIQAAFLVSFTPIFLVIFGRWLWLFIKKHFRNTR